MSFYLIGRNFKQDHLDLRQALYRRRLKINALLKKSISKDAVIFSTCNRFEIYGVTGNYSQSIKEINLIRSLIPELSEGQIELEGNLVLRHLIRLACGLESQLKGELQIFHQLKAWTSQPGFPLKLGELVDEAITLAIKIRVKSGLTYGINNIAGAILHDLKKHVGLERPKVVVVGTGKVAELFSTYQNKEVELYFAAHKNMEKAKVLADRTHGQAIELKEAGKVFNIADALVSATSSPHYLFHKKDFSCLTRQKKFYLYDIAAPADIEPGVSELEGVILKDLFSLGDVFEEFNSALRQQLYLAEHLVEEKYEQDLEDRYEAEPACVKTG